MSDAYNELDIKIEGSEGEDPQVTIRFRKADEARSTPRSAGPETIQIDTERLLEDLNEFDLDGYGARLRDAVFGMREVRDLYAEAMAAQPLRVRLDLQTSDQRLLELRWELMADREGAPLSTRRGLAFSRFLGSGREVVLRESAQALRALVAVVNPTPEEQKKYGLAEIDVDYERRAASLTPIACDPLTEDQGLVTMNRLMAALRQGEDDFGGYDILYLVCHGAMVRGNPSLLFGLETEREKAKSSLFRSGEQLARRMRESLQNLPRLVVLASCAGAGTGGQDALAATGPLLAKIGIPAVVAMQGYVNIDTVEGLLTSFFAELGESARQGKMAEVDRALQSARRHVRFDEAADDWWAPVLFMRLEQGELAFGEKAQAAVEQAAGGGPAAEQQTAAAAQVTTDVAAAAQFDMAKFDRVKLYQVMVSAFGSGELEELAFTINVEFEELSGSSRSAKVREFITYCERRGMIPRLLEALGGARPHIDWYAEAGLR